MDDKILNFKVVVEYTIENMVEESVLKDVYNGSPWECYKDTSCNFQDHPVNFTDASRVLSVEVIND